MVEKPKLPADGQSALDRVRSLAIAYGFTYQEIVGTGRTQRLVQIRAIVAHELRARGLSLTEIGQVLGHRDHTTILHMLRTHPKGE